MSGRNVLNGNGVVAQLNTGLTSCEPVSDYSLRLAVAHSCDSLGIANQPDMKRAVRVETSRGYSIQGVADTLVATVDNHGQWSDKRLGDIGVGVGHTKANASGMERTIAHKISNELREIRIHLARHKCFIVGVPMSLTQRGQDDRSWCALDVTFP